MTDFNVFVDNTHSSSGDEENVLDAFSSINSNHASLSTPPSGYSSDFMALPTSPIQTSQLSNESLSSSFFMQNTTSLQSNQFDATNNSNPSSLAPIDPQAFFTTSNNSFSFNSSSSSTSLPSGPHLGNYLAPQQPPSINISVPLMNVSSSQNSSATSSPATQHFVPPTISSAPTQIYHVTKQKKVKKRKPEDDDSPQAHAPSSSLSSSSALFDSRNFRELTSDEQIQLDSNQFQQYVDMLTSRREVSPDEDKELRKVRRLIKNREYAQSSRDKQKQHLDEIQRHANEAAQENFQLRQQVGVMRQQLQLVQDAINLDQSLDARLRSLVPSLNIAAALKYTNAVTSVASSAFEFAAPGAFEPATNSATTANAPVAPSNDKSSNSRATSRPKRARTTSAAVAVSLFVVVFSFGLFANNFAHSPLTQQQQPSWRTGRMILQDGGAQPLWFHQYAPEWSHDTLERWHVLMLDELPQLAINVTHQIGRSIHSFRHWAHVKFNDTKLPPFLSSLIAAPTQIANNNVECNSDAFVVKEIETEELSNGQTNTQQQQQEIPQVA